MSAATRCPPFWNASLIPICRIIAFTISGFAAMNGLAQEAKPNAAAAPPAAKPEPPRTIANDPKSIDAATLVDAKLRQVATVEFSEASLSDVVAWLQKQTGFNVSLDLRSLSNAGIDANSPITDRLQAAPIYLLLDRLERHQIGWRLSGGVLSLYHMGDKAAAYNMQYNVGDLLDQGYRASDLGEDAVKSLASSSWNGNGGDGDLVQLGDVMFIRQSHQAHRQIAALLAALRTPARRVLINDPAQHVALRAALQRPINVAFQSQSLGTVVDKLGTLANVDIRLDRVALRGKKTSERTPITFELNEQSVATTMDLLLAPLGLSWIIRDGAVWVTSADAAESFRPTAVYDVRDLCPDQESSKALSDAIVRQCDPESWGTNGGSGMGQLEFARPGVMVVTQTERRHDTILGLLENYRIALRDSKRRVTPEEDPEVVETKYYRMPTEVAVDLEKSLPQLIAADSWKSQLPNAVGSIRRIRSWDATAGGAPQQTNGANAVPVSYSVLIIEHKRKVHAEILKTLDRIKNGDAEVPGFGGMGGMGGGFF